MAYDIHWGSTVLALHFDGANNSVVLTDTCPNPKVPAPVGGAAIKTAQSKFGGASLGLSGSGQYVDITTHTDFDLPGNLTIEMWAYVTATDTSGVAFLHRLNGYELYATAARQIYFNKNGSTTLATTGTAAFPLGQWFHLAVTWDGANYRIFVDGAMLVAPAGTVAPDNGTTMRIGSYTGSANYDLNGYLDDVRITKGVCRYTATFTPPTEAFGDTAAPPISGTVLDGGGTPVARTVRAYRSSDGVLAGSTVSNGTTGAFSVQPLDGTEHHVMAFDTTSNAVVAAHVTPGS